MFQANINYFFGRSSGDHLVVSRSYYLSSEHLVDSADLDLTDFFYSLLCGSVDHYGIITFRDMAHLTAFVASLENFCILDFSRAFVLTDLQLLSIEHFLAQLTNSAVFLRDNF